MRGNKGRDMRPPARTSRTAFMAHDTATASHHEYDESGKLIVPRRKSSRYHPRYRAGARNDAIRVSRGAGLSFTQISDSWPTEVSKNEIFYGPPVRRAEHLKEERCLMGPDKNSASSMRQMT